MFARQDTKAKWSIEWYGKAESSQRSICWTWLELGLYDAIAHFNNGLAAVTKLFNALGITPGKYTEEFCKKQDLLRVACAERKNQSEMKKKRIILRGAKKGKAGEKKQEEGLTYASGGF